MIVGVLAFQGDFAEHLDVLETMGVPAIEVRTLPDLVKVDRLIIPGGESTVMAKFLDLSGIGKEIQKRSRPESPHPLAVFGTCAGAIIIARKSTGKNAPRALNLIDIDVDRNAYGSQANSFEAEIKVPGLKNSVPAAFIRAPKITRIGKKVEVLSKLGSDPVLVRQGRVMAATFHAEVRAEKMLHEIFLKMPLKIPDGKISFEKKRL